MHRPSPAARRLLAVRRGAVASSPDEALPGTAIDGLSVAGSGSATVDVEGGVVAQVPDVDAGSQWKALRIVSTVGPLPPDAPPSVIRDERGRVRLDVPSVNGPGGRQRSDLMEVAALEEIGDSILAAFLQFCKSPSPATWRTNGGKLQRFARTLDWLGMRLTPLAALPADVVDLAEAEYVRRQGSALSEGQQHDFNYVRRVLSLIPGAEHLDLEHRTPAADGPIEWVIDADGQPRPAGKFGLTDVDTELLAKRCSMEIRATMTAFRQLEAFLGGDASAAGPCSSDLLEAAAEMRRLHPGEPTFWTTDFRHGSEGHRRLLRIGWDEAGAMEQEVAGGRVVDVPPDLAQAIRIRRRCVDSGLGVEALKPDAGAGRMAMVGWIRAARLAYPTARDMISALALLGLQTRYNVGQLVGLGLNELAPRIRHENEFEDCDDVPGEATTRLYAQPYKPRARRHQPVDLPITSQAEDAGPLGDFLREWTRPLRGHGNGRLFIFAKLALQEKGATVDFAANGGLNLRREFAALCRRAGTTPLTPKTLRVMGVDIVHERTNGDQALVHLSGGWAPGSTSPSLYIAAPALGRERERLFWAGRLLDRELRHGVMLGDRPGDADPFAATDGFRCAEPLDALDPVGAGELCRSKGMCAVCPHGDIDMAAPVWALARMVALAVDINRRLVRGADARWSRRYRPVLAELLDVWIPMFPLEVRTAARRIADYPIGDLPDVPEEDA